MKIETCDVCGGQHGPLTTLRDLYKTEQIAEVCPACLDIINGGLRKIQATLVQVQQGWMRRFIANLRGIRGVHTDHPLRHYDCTCPACNSGVRGFDRTELEDAANSLDADYDRFVYVGEESPQPESVTAFAARFIRAALAHGVDSSRAPADPQRNNDSPTTER